MQQLPAAISFDCRCMQGPVKSVEPPMDSNMTMEGKQQKLMEDSTAACIMTCGMNLRCHAGQAQGQLEALLQQQQKLKKLQQLQTVMEELQRLRDAKAKLAGPPQGECFSVCDSFACTRGLIRFRNHGAAFCATMRI